LAPNPRTIAHTTAQRHHDVGQPELGDERTCQRRLRRGIRQSLVRASRRVAHVVAWYPPFQRYCCLIQATALFITIALSTVLCNFLPVPHAVVARYLPFQRCGRLLLMFRVSLRCNYYILNCYMQLCPCRRLPRACNPLALVTPPHRIRCSCDLLSHTAFVALATSCPTPHSLLLRPLVPHRIRCSCDHLPHNAFVAHTCFFGLS
jgi:hypothetical protein